MVLITSAANNLHKAHVQYIEARLVREGINALNTDLENNKNPSLPSLSEADKANMEAFLSQLLMILPAIRVDLFTSKVKIEKNEKKNKSQFIKNSPVFELILKKENIKATAFLEDGEFIVQKGSLARGDYIGERNKKHSYWKLYDKLVEQGVLINAGKHKVFNLSYAFSSTSAAGAVCNGRPTNGPSAWKIKGTRKAYKDWEVENLADD